MLPSNTRGLPERVLCGPEPVWTSVLARTPPPPPQPRCSIREGPSAGPRALEGASARGRRESGRSSRRSVGEGGGLKEGGPGAGQNPRRGASRRPPPQVLLLGSRGLAQARLAVVAQCPPGPAVAGPPGTLHGQTTSEPKAHVVSPPGQTPEPKVHRSRIRQLAQTTTSPPKSLRLRSGSVHRRVPPRGTSSAGQSGRGGVPARPVSQEFRVPARPACAAPSEEAGIDGARAGRLLQ
jgi:hypothetical protein